MKRMKRAEKTKKEIIKKNLIRHEQLISDPKIREKVDKLREERDEKRMLEQERKNEKKNKIGIQDTMVIEGQEDTKKNVVKEPKIISVRKRMKLKQKEKLIARRKVFKKK